MKSQTKAAYLPEVPPRPYSATMRYSVIHRIRLSAAFLHPLSARIRPCTAFVRPPAGRTGDLCSHLSFHFFSFRVLARPVGFSFCHRFSPLFGVCCHIL